RRADELADLVVVTMHAGGEGRAATRVRPGTEYFLGENRGDSMRFAHAVVDAGADLVAGHGPHVLRGMEWYRGRLIAYSLGNFLGCGTLSNKGILAVSGVLRVKLRTDGSWAGGRLVPMRLAGCGMPALDRTRSAHRLVASLSRRDFRRRAVVLSETGRIVPPR
ncbi:MAG: CapA family protein, partial [Actinomycetota bacterium]|nr:CapA family protein [Actinomycetota bacterium]